MSHAGRQVIFPAPRYADAWAAIAFLERSFGFERQQVHEGPAGAVAHAELRLGAASVGLSSAGGPVLPQNPWTSVRSGVYVALHDTAAADAHYARAHAAGADIAMPLEDADYGSRQYSVWDLERHLWCFGTYTHAPVDESRLFLLLRYADRPRAHDWLGHVFGFESHGTAARSSAEHLELTLSGGRLWLSRAAEGDSRWGSDWHATYVVVPDVEAHCTRAQRSGTTIVHAVGQAADGRHEYWARDCEQYLWVFGSRTPSAAA